MVFSFLPECLAGCSYDPVLQTTTTPDRLVNILLREYNYDINSSGGACYTIGTSTRCFGGSGGGIRANGTKGGGDGLYVDFTSSMNSMITPMYIAGKPNTGGGGGGGFLAKNINTPTLYTTNGIAPGSGGSGLRGSGGDR